MERGSVEWAPFVALEFHRPSLTLSNPPSSLARLPLCAHRVSAVKIHAPREVSATAVDRRLRALTIFQFSHTDAAGSLRTCRS